MRNLKKKLDKELMKTSNEQMRNFSLYRKEGNILATKIFGVLTSHARKESIEISRCKIAGSIGKRSSLGAEYTPDFDLVVFINSECPPFDDVVQKFERILSKHCSSRGLQYVFGRVTKHSLKFRIQTGYSEDNYISFDLLPASNLIPAGYGQLSKVEKEQMQTDFALMGVSKLDNPEKHSCWYSSSLADRTVSFTRTQSPFVHNMIRLAKWWNKGISYFDHEYLYGRSSMVELVAIFVGNEEEESARKAGTRPSISSAFQSLLYKFNKIDENMIVFFPFQTNPNQKELYKVYQKQIGKIPVILDPVNPYNNLADEAVLSTDAKRAFQAAAKVQLESLKIN